MCKPKKASMTEIVRAPSGFGMQNMTTDVLMRRTIAPTKSKVSPLKTFYLWCIIDDKSYKVPFAFSTACLKMHIMM